MLCYIMQVFRLDVTVPEYKLKNNLFITRWTKEAAKYLACKKNVHAKEMLLHDKREKNGVYKLRAYARFHLKCVRANFTMKNIVEKNT